MEHMKKNFIPPLDKETFRKCLERDHNAWNIMVKKTRKIVTKSVRYKLSAMNLTSAKIDVEDIVQDIYLKIWEGNKLLGVKNSICLSSWLSMIAVNHTLNYCRKVYFNKGELEKINFDDLNNRFGEIGKLKSKSLKDAMSKIIERPRILDNELERLINTAIDSLKSRQKMAVKLFFYDNVKQRDISSMMSVPENTVATYIRRAKIEIHSRINEYKKDII
jgi:RNA polymerase sigma-70 factor, ECF subfamily